MKWRKNIIDKKADPEFNDMIVGSGRIVYLMQIYKYYSKKLQEYAGKCRTGGIGSLLQFVGAIYFILILIGWAIFYLERNHKH